MYRGSPQYKGKHFVVPTQASAGSVGAESSGTWKLHSGAIDSRWRSDTACGWWAHNGGSWDEPAAGSKASGAQWYGKSGSWDEPAAGSEPSGAKLYGNTEGWKEASRRDAEPEDGAEAPGLALELTDLREQVPSDRMIPDILMHKTFLNSYLESLPRDSFTRQQSISSLCVIDKREDRSYSCTLTMPPSSAIQKEIAVDGLATSEGAQQAAIFEACTELRSRGQHEVVEPPPLAS